MLRLFLIIFLYCSSSFAATEISTPGTTIGIGTTSTKNSLSIANTLSIGSSSYTFTPAPTGGAIIEGNVGIGSFSPTAKLDVNGTIKGVTFIGNGASLTGLVSDTAYGGSWSGITGVAPSKNSVYNEIQSITTSGSNYWNLSPGNVGINTTTNNVGIGSISPSAKLDVWGGGIKAEPINKGYEFIISSPSSINNTSVEVNSFVLHKGKLIIGYSTQGTSNRTANVYSWDGGAETLLSTIGTGNAFQGAIGMNEYQGNLYSGILGASSGQGDIYVSTDDGATWTKSFDSTNDSFAWCSAVFKGKLYYGMGFSASRIRVFDGTTWTTSYAGLSGAGLVTWLYVYKGKLFAGLESSGGGGNPGILSTSDGVTWTVEYNPVKTLYQGFLGAVEYNGHLYSTTEPGSSNDILIRNDATGTWSAVATALTGSFCNPMATYNNRLYVGCTQSSGNPGLVYVSSDGVHFTLDFSTTQGDTEVYRLYNFNGSLYIGTGFGSNTGYIYRKTDSVGQQSDAINNIINRFRQNTTNAYLDVNDPSQIAITSPVNFDTNVGIGTFDASGGSLIVNGNVGISSVTPGTALDVTGTTRTTGFQLSTNPSSGYVLVGNSVGVGTWQPASSLPITGGGGGGVGVGTVNAGTLGQVTYYASSGTTVSGASNMFVSGSNTGIGSSSPVQALDVVGTIQSTSGYQSNGTGSMKLSSNSGIQMDGVNSAFTSPNLTVATTGNVGVGTVTPATTLEVAGTTKMTGFQLSTNPTSGYVLVGNSVGIGTWVPASTLPISGGSSQWATQNTTDVSLAGGNVGVGTTRTTTSAFTVMNGNVGIGTWVPIGPIDIISPSTSGLHDFVDVGGNIGISTVANGAVGRLFVVKANSIFSVDSAGTTTIANTNTGNASGWSINSTAATISGSNATAASALTITGGASTTSLLNLKSTSASGSGDSISFRTGNNIRAMTIDTNQNVGIGTNMPMNKLSILGNIGIGTLSGDPYLITAAPNGGMIIGGNVGIGTVTPGQLLDIQGNMRVSKIGSTIGVVAGANSCHGQSTLASGTVTVSTTCTPSSAQNIFLTDNGGGTLANIGSLYIGTVTGGTSFIINSSNALDSSSVGWIVIN